MNDSGLVCVASAVLPLTALGYVFIIPMLTNFKSVTRTQCDWGRPKNIFPSVSAGISFNANTTLVWFFLIVLHTPARFQLANLLDRTYKKILAEIYNSDFLRGLNLEQLRRFKRIQRVTKFSYWFNLFEIFGLCILSLFPSTSNYEMHVDGFGMYLIGAAGFTVCTLIIEFDFKKKNMVNISLSNLLHNSFTIRLRLSIIYFISFAISAFLFYIHNIHCIDYAYSWFGLFEVILIMSNIALHTYPSHLIIRNVKQNLLDV